MKKPTELPKALQNAKKSNWLESVKYQLDNEDWLDISFEIALRVYSKIKAEGKNKVWLAEQLDCSPQYVGKVLKGKENLTLQTITKLENILGIKLIQCPSISAEIDFQKPAENLVPSDWTTFLEKVAGETTPTFDSVEVFENEPDYDIAA